MLHAGLDLSRRRLDVCLVDEAGEVLARTAAAPDADGLRQLAMRVSATRVRAVIESMNGARFVHDTLEELGWEVLIADAQKVKGLAPLACKTDKIDAHVLAVLSHRDLVPAIWLPDPDDPARTRARPLSAALGSPPHHAQEPHPRDADHLRASVPGLGFVRPRRP
jgi:transposase